MDDNQYMCLVDDIPGNCGVFVKNHYGIVISSLSSWIFSVLFMVKIVKVTFLNKKYYYKHEIQ